jgi:hypothetical protein
MSKDELCDLERHKVAKAVRREPDYTARDAAQVATGRASVIKAMRRLEQDGLR